MDPSAMLRPMEQMQTSGARLVLVTGWTGAGKSTIAEAVARDIGATVASFDWLMSGLRAFPNVWSAVETPRELQRRVGWSLLSRVAEQQLRRNASCVLDLVAREPTRAICLGLAAEWGASLHVIECICSDPGLHRRLIETRSRTIPDWYEITFEDARRVRESYVPLAEPKLVLDAVNDLAANVALARAFLRGDDVD